MYQTPEERKRRGGMGSMGNAPEPAPGQLEGGYDEDAAPEPMSDAEGESGGAATVDAPLGILGGKTFQPGEEVVLKVVSVDPENKTVKLAYAQGKGDGEDDHMSMPDEHPAVSAMPE